jgi:hypothetical protein
MERTRVGRGWMSLEVAAMVLKCFADSPSDRAVDLVARPAETMVCARPVRAPAAIREFSRSSFADAEAGEQRVEDILDTDAAGDAAERTQGEAKVLCAELRQFGNLSGGEASGGFLQRGAVARLG